MLEVGVPSSTSGSLSSDPRLLLSSWGGEVPRVVGQAFLSGDLSVRGMSRGAEFSRRKSVTPAPGTPPRTFPTAPPSPVSLHFDSS